MKIAYFDCFAGVSGDMILGALVSAGVPLEVLTTELEKLKLPNWQLKARLVEKCGIVGTKVDVILKTEQQHRHLGEILTLLRESALAEPVKELAVKILCRLGEAEARVHGVALEQVHFHEVGALDSIIDIVGAAVGINYLGIERFYASALRVGFGTVQCAHGLLPVPAPATLELLRGVPVYSGSVAGELTTPTGAAVLTVLVDEFNCCPAFCPEQIGYGAGEKELSLPNLLRLTVGSSIGGSELEDEVVILETNIDDLNPQLYQHLARRCEKAGALDVSLSPLLMKKNRPANLLRVIAHPGQQRELEEIIFQETSTLGIRILPVKRRILDREIREIKTRYGPIKAKIAYLQGRIVNVQPEYEDCVRKAEEYKAALKDVMDEVKAAFRETYSHAAE